MNYQSTILVVDSDLVVQDRVSAALAREDYQLVFAQNGEQALAKLDTVQPAVVLLNLDLPVLDGVGFIRALGPDLSSRGFVVVVGAKADKEEEIKECFAAGVHSFLRQPFNIHELRGALRNAVQLSAMPCNQQARAHTPASKLDDNGFELEQIMASVPIGLLVLNAQGEILRSNAAAAEILVESQDRLDRRVFHELFPGVFPGGIRESLGQMVQTEKRQSDGKSTAIQLTLTPSGARNPETYLCSIVNLETPLELDEERTKVKNAQALSKANSWLLSSVSHELRTPLSSVVGSCELLGRANIDDECKSHVRDIWTSAQRVRGTLVDMLTLSEMQLDHFKAERVSFSLAAWGQKLKDVYEPLASAAGLGFSIEMQGIENLRLQADVKRFSLVARKLLDNAIQYTTLGAIGIAMEAIQSGELIQLRVRVSDSGCGIPEEHQATIFDSVWDVGSLKPSAFQSSGLGLTICKGVVELLGGEIELVRSNDMGSCFEFTVPARVCTVETDDAMDDESLPARPITVLLAEDDAINRRVIGALLKCLECDVSFAENGEVAVDQYKEGQFDVILMDCQMPVMDGLEATQLIRTYEQTNGRSATPIVAVSAFAASSQRDHCISVGMNLHLAKPLRLDTLQTLIHQLKSGAALSPSLSFS